MIRKINKKFKNINLENILLLLIFISSFFIGGENLYFKYAIIVYLFLIFVFKKNIIMKKYDGILLLFLVFILIYNIIIGNFNSDLLNFAILFFIFILIKNLIFDKYILSSLLIIFSIVHSIIIFYQSLILNKFRPPSTFVNPNWVVIWLFVGLYFLLFESNFLDKYKILKIPVSLLFLFGSILTLSRTTIILFLVFAVYVIFYKKKFKLKIRLLFLILLVVIMAIPVIRFTIRDKPLTFKRLEFYKAGLKQYTNNPIFGSGIKTVEDKIKKYYKSEERKFSNYAKYPRMSHNVFLEILIEMGLIGFLLSIFIFYKYFKYSFIKFPLLIYFISFLFNNLEKSFSLIVLFIILLSFNKINKSKEIKLKTEYKIIIFMILFYIFSFKLLSYIYLNIGKDKFQNKKYKKAYYYYKNAARFTKYDPYYQRIYVKFLINVPKNNMIGITWGTRFTEIEKTFEYLKKYDRFNSEVYNLYTFYCLKILRSDKFGKMKPEIWRKGLKNINKAINLNPHNPFYYYKKLFFYYMKDKKKKVKKLAKKAISCEPYFLRGYKILYKLSSNKKQKKEYKKIINRIKSIDTKKYKLNEYERKLLKE